jgi:pimeloyl-ACP methyl ester carboxylesterase
MITFALLSAFLLCEGAFAVWDRRRKRRLSALGNPPTLPQEDRRSLWRKCVEHSESASHWTSIWMYDVDVHAVVKRHHLEFTAWALFNLRVDEITEPETRENVLQCYRELVPSDDDTEDVVHEDIGERQRCCRAFTREPLCVWHKPYIFYCLYSVVFEYGKTTFFTSNGFTRRAVHHFRYWYKSGENSNLPIFFWHGFGCGLLPYWKNLNSIIATGRTVIVFELPFLTPALTEYFPSKDEVLLAYDKVCIELNIRKASHIGHSFGSVVMGWIVKHFPDRVVSMVFYSPVVFLLHFGDVCNNFVYKGQSPEADVIHKLISRDLTIQTLLKRNFWWYDKILWVNDMKCPWLVILAKQDQIVPSSEVRRYLLAAKDTEEVFDMGKFPRQGVHTVLGKHGEVLFGARNKDTPLKVFSYITDWLDYHSKV